MVTATRTSGRSGEEGNNVTGPTDLMTEDGKVVTDGTTRTGSHDGLIKVKQCRSFSIHRQSFLIDAIQFVLVAEMVSGFSEVRDWMVATVVAAMALVGATAAVEAEADRIVDVKSLLIKEI